MTRLIMLVCCAMLLIGCVEIQDYKHKFNEGDMVISKIDGRRGQIIWVCVGSSLVEVRFGAYVDSTSILGGSVSREPYSTVLMKEYELEAVDEKP